MSEPIGNRAKQMKTLGIGLRVGAGLVSTFVLVACSSAGGDASAGGGATNAAAGAGTILQGGGGSAGSPVVASAGAATGDSPGAAAGSGGASVVGAGGADSAGAAGAGAGGASAGAGQSAGSGGGAGQPATCVAGLPSSLSDLASKGTDSTVSKSTPMGKRYDGVAKLSATSDDVAFFHDASQQPPIPGSTSGLHLKALTVNLYPSGAGLPTPADINQHAIGNCDGDTAFAAISYLNPGFIKSIITDNQDNTFTVAMYDPMGKRMTISVDNQFLVDGSNNIGAVSGKNDVADWATVLEKATMKYVKVFPVVSDIGGIGSEHQTPMFTGTGGSIGFDRGKLSPSELTRVVKAALAAGKIISGGFGSDGMTLANGLQTVTAHGYAVFVPKDANTMISMRNPWGLDPTSKGFDGSTDGVLDIPSDPSWAATIDIRVIDPGDACGPGKTTPYLPLQGDIAAKALSRAPQTR
ncbi:MAG TPA: C2 family cysteine protease [Polyangiaceae bacterium]|nr:C2 family cysteine protease [Polyangiaceae bacterium]